MPTKISSAVENAQNHDGIVHDREGRNKTFFIAYDPQARLQIISPRAAFRKIRKAEAPLLDALDIGESPPSSRMLRYVVV